MTRSCHGLFDQSPGLRDRVIADEAMQISLYIAKTTFVFPQNILNILKIDQSYSQIVSWCTSGPLSTLFSHFKGFIQDYSDQHSPPVTTKSLLCRSQLGIQLSHGKNRHIKIHQSDTELGVWCLQKHEIHSETAWQDINARRNSLQ